MRSNKPKIIVYNYHGDVKYFKAYSKKEIVEYLGKTLSHVHFNSWIMHEDTISYHGDELIDLTKKNKK